MIGVIYKTIEKVSAHLAGRPGISGAHVNSLVVVAVVYVAKMTSLNCVMVEYRQSTSMKSVPVQTDWSFMEERIWSLTR